MYTRTDETLAEAMNMDSNELKQKITEDEIKNLFAAFNERGLLAKHDHLCCSTCASADLGDEADRDGGYIGIAYNHEQDMEYFSKDPTELIIRYCQTNDGKYHSKHIGMIISFIARSQGFLIDWDGNPNIVIRLHK